MLPERLNEMSEKSFSFIHVDVDLYYTPTRDSIRFF